MASHSRMRPAAYVRRDRLTHAHTTTPTQTQVSLSSKFETRPTNLAGKAEQTSASDIRKTGPGAPACPHISFIFSRFFFLCVL